MILVCFLYSSPLVPLQWRQAHLIFDLIFLWFTQFTVLNLHFVTNFPLWLLRPPLTRDRTSPSVNDMPIFTPRYRACHWCRTYLTTWDDIFPRMQYYMEVEAWRDPRVATSGIRLHCEAFGGHSLTLSKHGKKSQSNDVFGAFVYPCLAVRDWLASLRAYFSCDDIIRVTYIASVCQCSACDNSDNNRDVFLYIGMMSQYTCKLLPTLSVRSLIVSSSQCAKHTT